MLLATFTNLLMNIQDMPIYPPHPVFWRFIMACSVAYTTFFIILLFQPELNDIRNLFKIFDRSLNTPMKTKSYAEDCGNYSYEVISDKFDAFVFGHFIGWMGIAIFTRNREILHFSQILWEVVEIVTYYFIPNFGECWWDQIILDIFLCNGLGIELGLLITNYFKLPRWEWCWLWSWKNVKYKTLRFIGYDAKSLTRPAFKLGDIDQDGYEIYNASGTKIYNASAIKNDEQKLKNGVKSSGKNKKEKRGYFESYALIEEYFWALFGVPTQLTVLMLNAFLLKLWLWVPTEHWLNPLRLVFCAFVALPGAHQLYYGSIQFNRGIKVKTWSKKVHKFSIHCYSWLIMMGAEIGVIYRAKPEIDSMPFENKCWLIATVSLFVVYSWILCRAY